MSTSLMSGQDRGDEVTSGETIKNAKPGSRNDGEMAGLVAGTRTQNWQEVRLLLRDLYPGMWRADVIGEHVITVGAVPHP